MNTNDLIALLNRSIEALRDNCECVDLKCPCGENDMAKQLVADIRHAIYSLQQSKE